MTDDEIDRLIGLTISGCGNLLASEQADQICDGIRELQKENAELREKKLKFHDYWQRTLLEAEEWEAKYVDTDKVARKLRAQIEATNKPEIWR